ncbi:MAG: orotidine-5'-phosphate decarboxylase [Spirochaetae bacterium HGW-Spirochaetae-4]|nr:MAG: orotidine 5'-phosphate decarboxylase [Spirochaetes bacterium GWC2_52_13]PKL19970.1 MAG: orotidine-5'-phosphate decarboxylase [Spirochaetae bacterium HGW-Spirochaetae-4]HCG63300.1 orotidine-5'-phosphate decarboxylase [Sphaerochaeta sp.]HCS36615.1 orotidine-5'-phosphate decarboxylase [Sphaerochaeta sp.]
MKGYKTKLQQSAEKSGNCACMGLDPQWEVLPYRSGNIAEDLQRFFGELFDAMVRYNLVPAAFKPNIGYYSALDDPRNGAFEGSLALAGVLTMLQQRFPTIPVILDSKRGDIARSSANYAHEAFDIWRCDAVTASPYMGTDSVSPFDELREGSHGIYLLNRTSNPGAKDLQGLTVVDEVDEKELYPLYMAVAHKIAYWAEKIDGIGAVVGATNLDELGQIATYHGKRSIPLLIPGVGSQGASAKMTMQALRQAGYPVKLARINSSSALTHPWKQAPAPAGWLDRCIANIDKLLEETAL